MTTEPTLALPDDAVKVRVIIASVNRGILEKARLDFVVNSP